MLFQNIVKTCLRKYLHVNLMCFFLLLLLFLSIKPDWGDIHFPFQKMELEK